MSAQIKADLEDAIEACRRASARAQKMTEGLEEPEFKLNQSEAAAHFRRAAMDLMITRDLVLGPGSGKDKP